MKRLLPDTQLLVWLAERPMLLPAQVSDLLREESSEIFFSLVSIWEVSIKLALKRSDFTTDPRQLRDGLLLIGFKELPILHEHVIAVSTLPLFHRDPFDRLLVGQAKVEGLTLLTTDKTLSKYGDSVHRY